MKNLFIIVIFNICFGNIYQQNSQNIFDEIYYRKESLNWYNRFESTITYNDESTSFGEFRFNEDEEIAVWYRPLTKCHVEGIQIYFPSSTDLVNSQITVQLRSILDYTSIGIPANKEYNFSQYNLTIGEFMGEVLYSQNFNLSADMLEQVIDIDFNTPTDVEDNDFAIQIIGDFGGNNNDFIFWDGVNGINTNYNHGFKYYPDGASFCPEGCWVPRVNFGITAKVNYYGDHPPIISNVESLSDFYYSCNPGPYETKAEIIDIGNDLFDGELTNVKFYYNNGIEIIENNYTDYGINNIYTGYIPEHPIGTYIEYWWEATDNASNQNNYLENQLTIQRIPKSFTILEYSQGADILLIDDSSYSTENTHMTIIYEKLNQLGFSTDYLNIKDSGVLSNCGLDYYSNFILLQGLNGAGKLMPGNDLEFYLISRLSGGANLLFSSVDYIYEVASFTNGWNQTDPNSNQFLYNFLHVNEFINDSNPNDLVQDLRGITGNEVSNATNNFEVNSPFTQNYFDMVKPTAIAEEIFQIFDENEEVWTQYGGTIYSGNYKSIFFPWHFESIEDEDVLTEILRNTMDWFDVEYTPVFLDIQGPNGYIFDLDDQIITIDAVDNENDEITAELSYSINGGLNTIIAMESLNTNQFSATIPAQPEGTQVNYSILLSDFSGQIQSEQFIYQTYQSNSTVLLILNNEMEVGQLNFPAEYYLVDFIGYQDTGEFEYFITPDYWTLSNHGLTSEDLLNNYNTIIEITTTDDYDLHPNYNEHMNLIKEWLNQGNKNYVLAGDESFALANGNWIDISYDEEHLFYKLGIESTINDLSWGGVSELIPLQSNFLANDILGHLVNDEMLIYDPEEIIGYTNWMDGFITTDEAHISIEDNNGNAIIINKEWENGSKTIFMGIDPISIKNSLSNYWYGTSKYGILAQALDWFGEIILNIDNNIFKFPKEFKLYQNFPNPFNPSTKINFDISERTNVELTIYSLLGEIIVKLVNERLSNGSYSIIWNGQDSKENYVPSGIYFYTLQTENYTKTNKMMYIK